MPGAWRGLGGRRCPKPDDIFLSNNRIVHPNSTLVVASKFKAAIYGSGKRAYVLAKLAEKIAACEVDEVPAAKGG